MIYVGRFNEDDLRNGVDKKETKKAMEQHNLNYTETKLIKKSGKIVAMDIWVCNADEFKI